MTGTSISAHRLRLRTRAAIARIEAGEANLARLAIELGFSDHSHMCRAVTRETCTTPSSIRQNAAPGRRQPLSPETAHSS